MNRPWTILVPLLLMAGCQANSASSLNHSLPTPGASAVHPAEYSIIGAAPQADRHLLLGGETVSSVLRPILPSLVYSSRPTVVLVRRGPEGATREMIDFDSSHCMVNPEQDRILRDGDELILPSPPALPVGLQRPPAQSASSAN